MGLQKEWEKAKPTEETIKIEETLFTDDLTRQYRFDSRAAPHLIIEVYEKGDVITVRRLAKEEETP